MDPNKPKKINPFENSPTSRGETPPNPFDTIPTAVYAANFPVPQNLQASGSNQIGSRESVQPPKPPPEPKKTFFSPSKLFSCKKKKTPTKTPSVTTEGTPATSQPSVQLSKPSLVTSRAPSQQSLDSSSRFPSAKSSTVVFRSPLSAPSSQTNTVNEMMQSLKKSIEHLIENTPNDDPDFKKYSKKLKKLKKQIDKNAHPKPNNSKKRADLKPTKKISHSKVQPKAKRGLPKTSSLSLRPARVTSSTTFAKQSSKTHHKPQDLANVNLDDTLLYGIDSMISAALFIRNVFSK